MIAEPKRTCRAKIQPCYKCEARGRRNGDTPDDRNERLALQAQERSIRAEEAIERVLWKHEISRAELVSRDRHGHLVKARDEAAWALREIGLNLMEIGFKMKRDHSSISHSLKKLSTLERQLTVDGDAALEVEQEHERDTKLSIA